MLADHTPMGFIGVADIERATAFYVGLLGLKSHGFDGFALEVEAGPIRVRITQPPQLVVAPYTVFGWRTDDIERDVRALTAKGVAFERYAFFADQQDALGIWDAPDGAARVAWFKDPDGNVLSLSQHG
jgi:catechol 2,3-dioxygenase-like lactoylglutathione lyase family enzyme